PVGLQQPLGVDLRVDLRGGERGVPEQFLDGPQVPAAAEQVRREGMAERVRRRARLEAEGAPQPRGRHLDDARRERAAADAAEKRLLRFEGEGAGADIGLDGPPDGSNYRDDALAA